MTCAPGLLGTGLSLVENQENSGQESRPSWFYIKTPLCTHGDPTGSWEGGTPLPLRSPASIQRHSLQTEKQKAVWGGLRSPVSRARMVMVQAV